MVRSGNSGGPLITPDGSVLGMVFATALDSSDTGFVLSDKEIQSDADRDGGRPAGQYRGLHVVDLAAFPA